MEETGNQEVEVVMEEHLVVGAGGSEEVVGVAGGWKEAAIFEAAEHADSTSERVTLESSPLGWRFQYLKTSGQRPCQPDQGRALRNDQHCLQT